MVVAVITKLSKLDVMGALNVKYFGLTFGMFIVLYVLAYMTIPQFKQFVDKNIRSRLPKSLGGL